MSARVRNSGRSSSPAAPTRSTSETAEVPFGPLAPGSLDASLAASRPADTSLLTRPLGLEGWSALEPVVLAALASREPMLLVGKHGSAKSFLLERLAGALGLEFRFYNASLVNYDDLVGVPVPDESGEHLRYITTPTAIWDAEVVFIDELSRCRPDLANKLFPIVHERRVQGVLLDKLRYRWAAMNPPPADDGSDDEHDAYIGAEALDPALADRFAFLIEVPTWQQLTDGERASLLVDHFRGSHPFAVEVPELVAQAEGIYRELCRDLPARLADYYLALAAAREGAARPPFSTRRLTMLMRSAVAVHAARLALARVHAPDTHVAELKWEESVWLSLRHGDPELARGGVPDHVAQLALHRQAWAVSGLQKDDPARELLGVADPVERALVAIDLPSYGADELTPLVLDAVGSVECPALRITTSLAFYLALHRAGRLHATGFETIKTDVQRALVAVHRQTVARGAQTIPEEQLEKLLPRLDDTRDADGFLINVRDTYTRNLLKGLLPELYTKTEPARVHARFLELWARLRLDERVVKAANEDR
jgi:MoxR-like ATPase